MGNLLAICVLLLSVLPASAELRQYRLDPAESVVEFIYMLNGKPGTGTMPIVRADLALDFDTPNRSRAAVALDVTGTRTGTMFVTQALKSADVLAAETFPVIQFQSRSFHGAMGRARVNGDVTIRGVTRPVTLQVAVFRARGSDPDDLSQLTVMLTGHINRSAFGATGYADLVADRVELKIRARLKEIGP